MANIDVRRILQLSGLFKLISDDGIENIEMVSTTRYRTLDMSRSSSASMVESVSLGSGFRSVDSSYHLVPNERF